jgi:hypothetical protein
LVMAGVATGGHIFGTMGGLLTGGSSSGGLLTTAQLADWKATPAHPGVTSPLVEQTAAACLDSLDITSTGGAPTISNADQRGGVITLMVTSSGSHKRGWCLGGSQGVVLSQLVDTPSSPLPAIGTGSVNVQSEDSHGSGTDAISLAYGQAGADVTGLALTTPEGQKITATVQNGIWTLWWPPKDTSTGDLGGTVTWSTATGVSHSASVDSLFASK